MCSSLILLPCQTGKNTNVLDMDRGIGILRAMIIAQSTHTLVDNLGAYTKWNEPYPCYPRYPFIFGPVCSFFIFIFCLAETTSQSVTVRCRFNKFAAREWSVTVRRSLRPWQPHRLQRSNAAPAACQNSSRERSKLQGEICGTLFLRTSPTTATVTTSIHLARRRQGGRL